MMSSSNMSPYAPVRYRDHAWWRYSLEAARAGFVVSNGQIAGNLPDMIMSDLISPQLRLAKEHFVGHAEFDQVMTQVMAKAMEYRHWVPLAAQYELCGRQIFDLSDDLVEMLLHTDLGECTFEDWHAPYDAFFVRFGKQETLKVPFEDDFEYLDGAFVSVTPWSPGCNDLRIKFGFTTVHKDGSGVEMPGFFLDLSPEEQRLPVIEGFKASIKRRVASMHAPGDTDSSDPLTECRRGMLEEGLLLIEEGLALLVNALFYLEWANKSQAPVKPEPGRDTPADIVVSWETSPKKRAKLQSRMTSEGYVVVRLMGKEVTNPGTHRAGAGKCTHWRRGHWRQLRLSGRTWVKPHIVNAHKPHDDLPGHIYTTGGGDDNVKH